MAHRNLDPSAGDPLAEFPEESSLPVPPRRGRAPRVRRLPRRGLQRTQLFAATIGTVWTTLALATRRAVRKGVLLLVSVVTGLVPRRLRMANAIAFAVLVSVSVIVGLVVLRQVLHTPLATTLTVSWVPFAVPVMASIERPIPSPQRTPARNDATAIQRALNKYRDAFSVLDVTAVRAVWPSADERELGKEFAALYDQNVEFDSCRISMADATATAVCRGSVSYVRKQEIRRRHTRLQDWRFTLLNDSGRWIVETVVASSAAASRLDASWPAVVR